MASLLSKLRFHRGRDHRDSKTSKRHQHTEPEEKAASSFDPSINLTSGTKGSSYITASPTNLPEHLWNKAYDQLKQKEPKWVNAYETILSQLFNGDSSSHQLLQLKNLIEQADIAKRRYQMDSLIQVGLARTEKEARLKQSVGEVMQKISSLKEIISSAVQMMPQAALAWTGICFALQVFTNPTTESKANRDGLDYVISRMKWYNELSYPVFGHEINTDKPFAGMHTQLETQVIDLYQELLSYLIKSVCSYHRNRFVNFLRDTLMLDGWDGSLKNVKDAEKAFRQDSSVYNTQKNTINIETLANIAISSEDKDCLRHLRLSDPRDDKTRIEQTKGGLLQDSYRWILENDDFERWRKDAQSRLLWIKGDPGKGKTMLLCGIIDEIEKTKASTELLSYFFCQATDSRINTATAVLRGLIYVLVDRQPLLISHLRKRYDQAGKSLFEDANTWVVLSEIFADVTQDPGLEHAHLVIDALDECVVDLPRLLNLIVRTLSSSSRLKWIVSSRNWPLIEEWLERQDEKVKLSLELNAKSVSKAVHSYIEHKVYYLAKLKGYEDKTKTSVREYLLANANGTFLWVALVCQNLENTSRWKTLTALRTYPPGLKPLYQRMMKLICDSEDSGLFKQILALAAVVYRPIMLNELNSFIEMPKDIADDPTWLEEPVKQCGSFLTIRESTIYFVHQSAKDFVLKNIPDKVFPSGAAVVHYNIYSKSMEIMSKTLHRDLYNLRAPGFPIKEIQRPDPDPLAEAGYACLYWVDHLADGISSDTIKVVENDFCNSGAIAQFLSKRYLYWLEALSLLQNVSNGVLSIIKLDTMIQGQTNGPQLVNQIRDARRFILYYRQILDDYPLQVYTSALLFSPINSLVKEAFNSEKPKWVTMKMGMENDWSACLQTLQGHSDWINAIAFSPDGKQLASGSSDETIRLWDAIIGNHLWTLQGHSGQINTIAFSPDGKQLASGSIDKTIRLWDTITGDYLWTLQGHSDWINAIAFSPNGKQLMSGSSDKTIRLWDITIKSDYLWTLQGYSGQINTIAFSPNGKQLASSSSDKTIRLWDATIKSDYLWTLQGHSNRINTIAFSPNGKQLASGSRDKTIRLWDTITGDYLWTLRGHSSWINAIAFSPDGKQLASGSSDKTIRLWDTTIGNHLQTLQGYSGWINAIAFSPDGKQLASGSSDKTIRLWDATIKSNYLWTLQGHSNRINTIAFSPNGKQLASGSNDKTIRLWDAITGDHLWTLQGHSSWIRAIAFSPDGKQLASGSSDKIIKLWDAITGNHLWTLQGHLDLINTIAFSPNNKQLASGSIDETIRLWDAITGDHLWTLQGYSGWIRAIAFSSDDKQLASSSDNGTIRLWDATMGDHLWTLQGHSDQINAIIFSPDGKQLASGSDDKTIRLWDTTTGDNLQIIRLNVRIRSLFFHQDPSYLETDRGLVEFRNSKEDTVLKSQSINKVFVKDDWIMQDAKNVLWLPSEYRATCSSVRDNMLSLGHASGKVTLFEFNMHEMNR